MGRYSGQRYAEGGVVSQRSSFVSSRTTAVSKSISTLVERSDLQSSTRQSSEPLDTHPCVNCAARKDSQTFIPNQRSLPSIFFMANPPQPLRLVSDSRLKRERKLKPLFHSIPLSSRKNTSPPSRARVRDDPFEPTAITLPRTPSTMNVAPDATKPKQTTSAPPMTHDSALMLNKFSQLTPTRQQQVMRMVLSDTTPTESPNQTPGSSSNQRFMLRHAQPLDPTSTDERQRRDNERRATANMHSEIDVVHSMNVDFNPEDFEKPSTISQSFMNIYQYSRKHGRRAIADRFDRIYSDKGRQAAENHSIDRIRHSGCAAYLPSEFSVDVFTLARPPDLPWVRWYAEIDIRSRYRRINATVSQQAPHRDLLPKRQHYIPNWWRMNRWAKETKTEARRRRTPYVAGNSSLYFLMTWRDVEYHHLSPKNRASLYCAMPDWMHLPEPGQAVPTPIIFQYKWSILIQQTSYSDFLWAVARSEWTVLYAATWIVDVFLHQRMFRLHPQTVADFRKLGLDVPLYSGEGTPWLDHANMRITVEKVDKALQLHDALNWEDVRKIPKPLHGGEEFGDWVPFDSERCRIDWNSPWLGVRPEMEIPWTLVQESNASIVTSMKQHGSDYGISVRELIRMCGEGCSETSVKARSAMEEVERLRADLEQERSNSAGIRDIMISDANVRKFLDEKVREQNETVKKLSMESEDLRKELAIEKVRVIDERRRLEALEHALLSIQTSITTFASKSRQQAEAVESEADNMKCTVDAMMKVCRDMGKPDVKPAVDGNLASKAPNLPAAMAENGKGGCSKDETGGNHRCLRAERESSKNTNQVEIAPANESASQAATRQTAVEVIDLDSFSTSEQAADINSGTVGGNVIVNRSTRSRTTAHSKEVLPMMEKATDLKGKRVKSEVKDSDNASPSPTKRQRRTSRKKLNSRSAVRRGSG